MIHVLYVVGWGRSGSTMLDTALGSVPGVVSTGELRYLWERGMLERRLCGCGAPVPTCPFWTGVFDRLSAARAARGARPARPDAAEVVALQRAVARTRHVPGMADRRDPRLEVLRGLAGDLVRAIAAEAGVSAVVDSSKFPADAALYLGAGDDVRLHLVHLVRDPRAVAHSWQRSKPITDTSVPTSTPIQSPLRSSSFWTTMNVLAERLAPLAASSRRVRYEDLVGDPATVLAAILDDTGLDLDAGAVVGDGELHIRPNHTVAGNPDRFQRGVVPLRPDDAWRAEQSRTHRWLATLPALPRLRRYGYGVEHG